MAWKSWPGAAEIMARRSFGVKGNHGQAQFWGKSGKIGCFVNRGNLPLGMRKEIMEEIMARGGNHGQAQFWGKTGKVGGFVSGEIMAGNHGGNHGQWKSWPGTVEIMARHSGNHGQAQFWGKTGKVG